MNFIKHLARAAVVAVVSALLALQPIADSWARNPRGTPIGQSVAPQGLVKFGPGNYLLAGNGLYATTPAQAYADIQQILANMGSTPVQGYTWGAQWTTYDKSTSATSPTYDFSSFWQIANLLQALWPGAKPRLRLAGNHYVNTNVTATQLSTANMGGGGNDGFFVPHALQSCGGSITVPNGFGSSSTTTYPVAAVFSGSPNYGMNFQDHSGTVFKTVTPQWYNPGVTQLFINMVQAFFASTGPAPAAYSGATTYSLGMQATTGGSTYTWINPTAGSNSPPNSTFWALTSQIYVGKTPDQILWGFGFNDEVSNAFITSDNITGVTVNPPLSVTGGSPSITVNPTNAAFWNQFDILMQATVAVAPHTIISSAPTYGWGAGSSIDSTTNVAANTNANAPSGNRSAPIALSSITDLALSGADTYGFDFNATNNRANNAKQGFYGIPVPGAAGTSLPTPTVANLIGKKQVVAQVQPADYFFNVSGAGNNASAVQQVLTAGEVLHAQEFEWSLLAVTDSSRDTAFPTYLFSTLLANPLPSSSFWRTPDIMTGIAINAVTVASTTSLTITWSPPALDAAETGLTETLYRNGVVCPSCTGLTSGTFTDTGLTHGTTYTYTMAMANSNGTGPQGAGVPGTP